jgi:hypothetical protein
VRFAFVWPHKETKYNTCAINLNKNGTYDKTMCQINDSCWNDCVRRLPEDLRKRKNLETDPEVAIALLYCWINSRVDIHLSWCYLNDEAWFLYWKIGEIQKEG